MSESAPSHIETDLRHMSQLLRLARRSAFLSQPGLAAATDIPRARLRALESGRGFPSGGEIAAIFMVLEGARAAGAKVRGESPWPREPHADVEAAQDEIFRDARARALYEWLLAAIAAQEKRP